MTEFNPPISERETEELIEIKYSSTDDWNQEAINQAKAELIERKISQREQDKVINEWDKQRNKYLEKEKKRLESNKTESYKPYQIVLLFLFGPIIFFRPYWFGSMTIFELRQENFKLKFKQRLIIFILSFISWFYYIQYDFEKMEQERMEEIEKIDISDWEKKHGYDK